MIYTHPTGGQMTLPERWQVTQTQVGLQLVPPDLAYTPQGPAEIYLVSAQPAPGLARVDDPRVVAYVDQSLRQLVPTLSPAGAPSPCGPGILLRWDGRNLVTGGAVLAVALLQLANGAIAGIVGLGEGPRVEARLPDLIEIFGSFTKGEGRRDPALAGTWHDWSYKGSSSMISGASTSSESRRTMLLGADGTVLERSSHEGIGSFTGGGGYAGYAQQSGDGRTGTWTAGDGMLFIQWSDGSSAGWQYQLAGAPGQRRLALITPGERTPYEWTEQPVSV